MVTAGLNTSAEADAAVFCRLMAGVVKGGGK